MAMEIASLQALPLSDFEITSPPIDLFDLFLKEVSVSQPHAAHKLNRPSASLSPPGGLGFSFIGPSPIGKKEPRLYSIAADKPTHGELLSPQNVFVKYVSSFEARLLPTSPLQLPNICVLQYPDTPKRHNINVSDPMIDFVAAIKERNISKFTEGAVCYLGKEEASSEVKTEYMKIINAASVAEVENFDSIRIWQRLTIQGEIVKAVEDRGLIEAPMLFDDVSSLWDMFPVPSLAG